MIEKHGKLFNPTICVTRSCNLNCVYCYQKHKGTERMDFPTAKACVDEIFSSIPGSAYAGVLLKFMGGEPLLEFDLLRQVYEYVHERYPDVKKMLFATTNGTLLNDEMKAWFHEHRQSFYLGLSIDGTAEVHNHNRSGSFDMIDTRFGFQKIRGVNLAEGNFLYIIRSAWHILSVYGRTLKQKICE